MRVAGTLLLVLGVSVAWLLGIQGYSAQQAIDHVSQLLGFAGGQAGGGRGGSASKS